jgi:very-short-patch-repair endonuclease
MLVCMDARGQGVFRVGRSDDDKAGTPPDLRVARLASEQDGIVDLRQLMSIGLNRSWVHIRVRSGRLHRIHRGVYAVGHEALTLRARLRAAVMACGDGAVLSHASAGALWGILPEEAVRVPEVTVVASTRRHDGIRTHRVRQLDPRDITRRHAIPITTTARTLLDLADCFTSRALRRAVRQAQAEQRVNVRQIADVLTRAQGRRGTPKLAAIIAGGPAPTRSEAEDIVLDLIVSSGLRHPDVNQRHVVGGRTLYPDMRWPEQRLIVEVDSAKWHDGALARGDDGERQALLEASGERVLRIFWEHALTDPDRTLARLLAAGAPPATALPRLDQMSKIGREILAQMD